MHLIIPWKSFADIGFYNQGPGTSYYRLVTTAKTWDSAEADAVSKGGHLARIKSGTENTTIFNTVANTVTTTANDGGGARYVWIGGKETTEGTYAWVDSLGTPFWSNGSFGASANGLYQNWGRVSSPYGGPEPDNYLGTQNRVAMALGSWPSGVSADLQIGSAGQWNDLSGYNALYYVIEWTPEEQNSRSDAPSLTLPSNITVAESGNGGARVTYPSATASHPIFADVTLNYSHASGDFFPVGTTTVSVTATAGANLVKTGTFTVSVRDVTPPVLNKPANVSVEATGPSGALVSYDNATATDNISLNPTITYSKASDTIFPLGVNIVTVTARDDFNNVSSGTFTVTVRDTTSPVLSVPANITTEATSAAGALVNYPAASATDGVSSTSSILYNKSSGSVFPLGTNIVVVAARDGSQNITSGTFTVTVRDTTPPVLNIPANLIVEASSANGAIVTYPSATATDNVTAKPTITYSPANGSLLPIGTNPISLTATDAAGNSSTGTFAVTVLAPVAPVLNLPPNVTIEATNPGGTLVNYNVATATDNLTANPTISYSKASGSAFLLGQTAVLVSAKDEANNLSSGTFTVTVRDTTAPVLSIPSNVIIEATSASGAVVTYPPAVATDNATAIPTITYTPPTGSTFPIGTSIVNITATDDSNNVSSGTFTVAVLAPQPPLLNTPLNIVAEATSPAGASVIYPAAIATDNVTTHPILSYSKASGSSFPIGITPVTVSARDEVNNVTSGTFSVTVRDTTPPSLGVPSNIIAEATNASGAVITYPSATATDNGTALPIITYSKPSGTVFPIGVTTISVKATDEVGNAADGTFTVTVQDTTPPTLVVPSDIVIEATNANGTLVKYAPATATDNVSEKPAITYSKQSGTIFPIGVTNVSVSAKDAANNITTKIFSVHVTPKPGPNQTIGFELPASIPKTYGDSPALISANASSGLPVSLSVVTGSPARFEQDGKTLVVTGAGIVKVRAIQSGNSVYKAASPVEKSFVVGKKKLTVTPQSSMRLVGAANPNQDLIYTGFIGTDTHAVLDKKPTLTTTAVTTSPAGKYTTNASGGADNNYEFVYSPGTLTVKGFGGVYEALLFDSKVSNETRPVGKIELSVLNNALSYSGVVTLGNESAPVKLSGGILVPTADATGASSRLVLKGRKDGKTALPDLALYVEISGDEAQISITVGEHELVSGKSGAHIYEPLSNGPVPWSGTYTMLIGIPQLVNGNIIDSRPFPQGQGYASVAISSQTGLLTLTGKLADGTLLNTSCRTDSRGRYRIFVNPYTGRAGSYVGGALELKESQNGWAISPEEGRLVWNKGPKSKDPASYSLGFGPTESSLTLTRWQLPVLANISKKISAIPLIDRLGLKSSVSGGAVEIKYSGTSLGDHEGGLPTAALLGFDNKTVRSLGANSTKWTMSVDPISGTFKGSFELADFVSPSTQAIIRAVTFGGILCQSGSENAEIGGGHFLLQALPGAGSQEATSGGIEIAIRK
ncbi:MAG: HYR domain-containing protein [Verrucomicrobiota bacterium]